jgi:hypothetical protein
MINRPRSISVDQWPADVPVRARLESLLLAADHGTLWSDRSFVNLWRQRVASGRHMLPHGPRRAPGIYARLSFSPILGETDRYIGPFTSRQEARAAIHAAIDSYPMSHAGAEWPLEVAPWGVGPEWFGAGRIAAR